MMDSNLGRKIFNSLKSLLRCKRTRQKNGPFAPLFYGFNPLQITTCFLPLVPFQAVFLTLGVLPFASAIVSYTCYLSLMVVGEPFLSFQWIFYSPRPTFSLFFLPITRFHHLLKSPRASNFGRLLLVGLLAKLMLESGLVKFTYFAGDGSNAWRDLTVPCIFIIDPTLPHAWSPWIHSLPSWFDQISLYWMYAGIASAILSLRTVVNLKSWFIRANHSCSIIMATGNYGFFNL